MARYFSTAKNVSAFVTNKISPAISWRGYAAAASQGTGVSNSGASAHVMLKKGSEEPSKISWVPDPVTGYYRPENQAKEVDAAELRATLIKDKTRRK
ncbi:protein SENESCENCE-ASSOCIATED GENE 21, mitochondrial-like [Henckelia pumila]|uniref:protein SENESCENCE-ASSOCIATED GENE 21, mitochondrial-like n=1 Tax=Henckelia pumila TaxID=405737 RepID=UPI003C6E365F